MSDVSENILNNADTTNTFPVSKAEHGMGRLTEARWASWGRGEHTSQLCEGSLSRIMQNFHLISYCEFHRGIPLAMMTSSLQFHLAFLMPLHSGVGTDCIIRHKIIQYFYPGIVVGEVVIVLSCYFPHLEGKNPARWVMRADQWEDDRWISDTNTKRNHETFFPPNCSNKQTNKWSSLGEF